MAIKHIGLLDFENKAVIELADDVDGLSPDILKYYGPRETSAEKINGHLAGLLFNLRNEYPGRFQAGIAIWDNGKVYIELES